MLSAKRSRHRIPIALVALCLVSATLPGVFCPIVCLTHEAMTLHEPHAGQMMAMPPCHTGDGVKPAQPRGDLTLVALPASGCVVVAADPRPAVALQLAAFPLPTFSDIPTPPPRIR
jgi:hypothetical protein